MYRVISAPSLVATAIVIGLPAPLRAVDAADVQAQVERLGGYILHDSTAADQPMTTVSFSFTEVTDDDLEILQSVPNLSRLQLKSTPIGDSGLERLRGLVHLRFLDLEDTRITDAGLNHLSKLTNLETLHLWDTDISDAGLHTLSGLTNLKEVQIGSPKISNAGLEPLASLPKLDSLWLRTCPIDDDGLRIIARKSQVSGLGLEETRVSDKGLAVLKEMSKLRSLGLGGRRIRDESILALQAIPNLAWLSLTQTQVTDDGLVPLKNCPNLRGLTLASPSFTDNCLAHIALLPRLESLLLVDMTVTDAGLKHLRGNPRIFLLGISGAPMAGNALAQLKNVPQLQYLFLSDTPLTDQTLAALKEINLTTLFLDGTGVTDKSLAHLPKSLVTLDLQKCQITDGGLGALKKMTKLGYLGLGGTKVTDAGLRQLKRTLVDVKPELTLTRARKSFSYAKQLLTSREDQIEAAADFGRQSHKLRAEGHYPQALAAAQQMIEHERAVHGLVHQDVAASLEALGELYLDSEKYDRAQEHFQKAVEIRRQLGQDESHFAVKQIHIREADVVLLAGRTPAERSRVREAYGWRWQALQNLAAGRTVDAEGAARKCLERCRELLGADHLDTAGAHALLGVILNEQEKSEEAREHLEKAVRDYEKNLGEVNGDAPRALTTLGLLAAAQADFTEARKLLSRAEDLSRRANGAEHMVTATALNNLAQLRQNVGDYGGAEDMYREAISVFSKVRGRHDVKTVTARSNLGQLFFKKGDYVHARSEFEQVLADARGIGNARLLVVALGNLGTLLRAQHDLAAAEPYFREALELARQAYGETHSTTIGILSNLAQALEELGNDRDARATYEEVIDLNAKAGRGDHPDHALFLNNLSTMLISRGEHREAKQRLDQAIEIIRKTVGTEHLGAVLPLCNLGVTLHRLGEPKTVWRAPLDQAVGICVKTVGEYHPETVGALSVLCSELFAEKEYALVQPQLERLSRIQLRLAATLLGTLSEAEAMAYVEDFHITRSSLLSTLRHLPKATPEQAYAPVWSTRALATRALVNRHTFSEANPKARVVWESLRDIRAQLAVLTLTMPAPGQAYLRNERLAELNRQKEALERQLALESDSYRQKRESDRATLSDLAACLPADGAVVDLVRFVLFEPGSGQELTGTLHYDAFVLRPDMKKKYSLSWIHLGPARPIDEAIDKWRKILMSGPGRWTGLDLLSAPQDELRRLVWAPIEEKLAGCSSVFLVPDGPLTGVPWAALPGAAADSHLLDQYTIGIVAFPQHLYELARRSAGRAERVLAVGGVDYGVDRDGLGMWQPLKGTLPEAESVAREAQEQGFHVSLLAGLAPSVSAVVQELPKSSYVHLATHGYFFQPAELETSFLTQGRFTMAGKRARVTARNPLTLSVIALAGANRPAVIDDQGLPTTDNGLLIAERVAELDLSSSRIVILSACQTGLGEVTGSEGVFGLQRAFGLAGTRSVIASLWSVPDQETSNLMSTFYTALWKDQKTPSQALQDAQRLILATLPATHSEHEKTWSYAAWILSGDPGTLRPGPPPSGVDETQVAIATVQAAAKTEKKPVQNADPEKANEPAKIGAVDYSPAGDTAPESHPAYETEAPRREKPWLIFAVGGLAGGLFVFAGVAILVFRRKATSPPPKQRGLARPKLVPPSGTKVKKRRPK
jgi:CHAT domain-containing protein/Tfp pilus assembly protein PilF/Leucine-rich repeat (LRR) protein